PDWTAGADDRRLLLGPHLDPLRSPSPVLPGRGGAGDAGAVRDAELADAVDRGRHAMAAGRLAQHLDGAVPRLRRRPDAGAPAPVRLPDAALLHRRRLDRKIVA